ncbi:MAG: type II toxin-antitoxin system HicB family antitoxin [Candidatus Stahlbacteria bacterium]|nr:type II toxin-antitoxin system HicB family antitoxin [Candidatus Stahlbacteria bacterium]
MYYNFTAIFEKGEKYYIGYCIEIPEANGQGKNIDECKQSLIEAIKLVLEDRKTDIIRSLPGDVIKEEVRVE